MMIELEGGYIKKGTYFVKNETNLNGLFVQNIVFIQSNDLNQNIEALLEEKNINTIRLTDDYKYDNLDFLKEYDLSFIKSIDINSNYVNNIEGLYELKNIERIGADNKNIDFTKFPKIRAFTGELSDFSYESISDISSMEKLRLLKFKHNDLSIFSNNLKINELMLGYSKITSLKGLEKFLCIENIELFHNRRLSSLEGIITNHSRLKYFRSYSTPNLFKIDEYLRKLPQLKLLQLGSKKVDSFNFLDNLLKLELLDIHNLITNVEDNNKEPLINALKRTGSKIW